MHTYLIILHTMIAPLCFFFSFINRSKYENRSKNEVNQYSLLALCILSIFVGQFSGYLDFDRMSELAIISPFPSCNNLICFKNCL